MRVRFLLLLLCALAAPVQAARLTSVSAVPGTVTIIADGRPAVAHQMALDAPLRLVVDLPAVLPAPLTAPGAGSVTTLRAAMFAPGVARLVIDLSAPVEIVSAQSSANGLSLKLRRISTEGFAALVRTGRRPLPVDTGGPPLGNATAPPGDDFALPDQLAGKTGPAVVAKPRPDPAILPPTVPAAAGEAPPITLAPAADAPVPLRPEAVAVAPPQRSRAPGVRPRTGKQPLVVIDAGHGGKDVGAISVTGAYEKAVTLAIATATARLLERRGKVRVKLTRADDRFIPLGGRVTIARNARADLFISIHADSAANAEARGASVYTLSAVASDAIAARLAARENKADIIGGVNLGAEAPEVGDIMIDLSRRATGNVSVAFAEVLQDELSDRINFRGEFHHFAGFWVLKAPDVPSVLLETGYVSNSEDAALLFSDAGRKRIAEGIARAIERHLVGD